MRFVYIYEGKTDEAALVVPAEESPELSGVSRPKAYKASELRKDGTPSTKFRAGSRIGVKLNPYRPELEGGAAWYDEKRERVANVKRAIVAARLSAITDAKRAYEDAQQELLALYADEDTRAAWEAARAAK